MHLRLYALTHEGKEGQQSTACGCCVDAGLSPRAVPHLALLFGQRSAALAQWEEPWWCPQRTSLPWTDPYRGLLLGRHRWSVSQTLPVCLPRATASHEKRRTDGSYKTRRAPLLRLRRRRRRRAPPHLVRSRCPLLRTTAPALGGAPVFCRRLDTPPVRYPPRTFTVLNPRPPVPQINCSSFKWRDFLRRCVRSIRSVHPKVP